MTKVFHMLLIEYHSTMTERHPNRKLMLSNVHEQEKKTTSTNIYLPIQASEIITLIHKDSAHVNLINKRDNKNKFNV